MTKHGDNQLRHFCWQSIMGRAIITETYCRVMAVYTKGCTDACSRRKRKQQGQAAWCIRGFFQFAGNLSKRVNFYPLSENVPTIMSLTLLFHYSSAHLHWAIIRGRKQETVSNLIPHGVHLDCWTYFNLQPSVAMLHPLTGGKRLLSPLIDSRLL